MDSSVCSRFGADSFPPEPGDKLGIALQTLHLQPLNALRLNPENGTCGWYIWGGEQLSDAADFFQPLHVSHLGHYAPSLVPYLNLSPGWRVLLAPDFEDVWFDQSLLKTS